MFSQYESLSLHPKLKTALKNLKFIEPTPIQKSSIPSLLEGRDLLGQADTGTGKTLAYLTPLIEGVIRDPRLRCLILAPTRELAGQIVQSIEAFVKQGVHIRTALLTGGTSMIPQFRKLVKDPQIIVATPGRLLDHHEQGTVILERVSKVVLDEADRMLDMGFSRPIREILSLVAQPRQTMLFSATFPSEVLKLSKEFLKNPETVRIQKAQEEKRLINHQTEFVDPLKKNDFLVQALSERSGSVLIFARTQVRTERAVRFLENKGFQTETLHGGLRQGQRNRALQNFREQRVRFLVATDVAARGLDVDHVEHVINYDLPQTSEDYIHRIGRTGRAGRTGSALTIVTKEDLIPWRIQCRELGIALRVTLNPYSHEKAGAPVNNRQKANAQASHKRRRDRNRNERSGGRPSGQGHRSSR